MRKILPASFIVDLKEEMKDIFCCNSHEVDELGEE